MIIPRDYESFQLNWQQNETQLKEIFERGECSFIPNLLPSMAVKLPGREILTILAARLGESTLQSCLSTDVHYASPLHQQTETRWIRRSNMVGVNVRTIGSFWNLVKYAFCIPASQDSIHILPIWEPGGAASLYAMSSWRINPEFYSSELAQLVPQLDTVEKQLHVVINLLHALGKKVGMDVIPHTDRYSEIVLANPQYFEWLQRSEIEITDHSGDLHKKVQTSILDFLEQNRNSHHPLTWPTTIETFFSDAFPEVERLKVLFGENPDFLSRIDRRLLLIDWLFQQGLEPVPATMGPPYRGLELDPSQDAMAIDSTGRIWRDYRIIKPWEMSRVFGPLTRYKLYEALDNNRDWAIDFQKPRKATWTYVCEKYRQVQALYNFDFMRGDMSHVQMRPDGVPAETDEYYDLLSAVHARIKKDTPYFAYFAETFLTAPGYMAYGNEIDHLEQCNADVTLGDLQSQVVGSAGFMQEFRRYLDLLKYRKVAPCFTILTGDKDDPRFDQFYVKGNEARLFISLFLTDMPSYMALGFESRDTHLKPAPNEYYTKLYVFQLEEGSKSTQGPYRWGQNAELFHHLSRLRLFAEKIGPDINDQTVRWLLPPDPTAGERVIAWTQAENPSYLFVVNLHILNEINNIKIPKVEGLQSGALLFSTAATKPDTAGIETYSSFYQIDQISPGEGKCFSLHP
ncbi:MAG: hypothetical protein DHS20C18_03330 [Saprospiraceae bacterium]|nr:MAG: hypothetical protein DHS20C18_03330 [Saprospiraceae bacterium]